jgi:hypothetical protein
VTLCHLFLSVDRSDETDAGARAERALEIPDHGAASGPSPQS